MVAVRIGGVSYLNARPLVHGLQSNADYSLCLDTPGALSEKLRHGEIDVGLVPIVEYLRGVGDTILPGICIACDGPVQTVKLFSRVEPARITKVAVDSSSRTSVALLRILLAERYGIMPDFHTFRPDLTEMLRAHDAALLIGDAAFVAATVPHVWDLGQGWKELTGLPFVPAVWTLRQGVDVALVAPILNAARDSGLRHREEIAREAARTLGLPESLLCDYLCRVLHYTLGEREMRSLETFQRFCVRYNIVSSARPLRLAAPLPVAAGTSAAGSNAGL